MNAEYTSILRNRRQTKSAAAEATVVKVHYLCRFFFMPLPMSLESNTETELGFADDLSFHGQLN